MNFLKAFSDTIGKEAPAVSSPASQSFSSDDMKAYVDAKFEALKTDLLSEMNQKVETPQETDNKSQEIKNNKEEQNNASNSDLSGSQSDS